MRNFLLIDDHAVVRSGMKAWLSEEYKPSKVEEASNGNEAIYKIKENNYDLLLMDIQMPDTNTLDLLKYIITIKPQTKVLMFSMNAEEVYAKRYLQAGAKGFVSKHAPVEEIKKAINLVINNRKYFSDSLMQGMFSEEQSSNNPFEKLSDREFEITNLLLDGKKMSEISSLLNIQNSTAGTHKARIFEKLNITNIVELIQLAAVYIVKK